jgi:hypothetical protein
MTLLATYQGKYLLPGMNSPVYATEADNYDWGYGSLLGARYVGHAIIDGSSVDAGNTGNTSVLRNGLIMAQVTATGKWKPFVSGQTDGTQLARGILLELGLNMNVNGSGADRFLATILVGGVCLNPGGLCVASTAGYGLARTGVGLAIRKHLMYAFQFSDDFMNDLTIPLSGR